MITQSSTGFKLPEPDFKSKITDLVMELEFQKRNSVIQTTESELYEQLRTIFFDLDSISSSRIEGNKTGLSRYLESKEEDPDTKGRKTIEIDKLSEGYRLVYENIDDTVFFTGFFIELHKIIRDGITKDSSRSAGQFRRDSAGESPRPKKSPAAHLVDPFLNKLLTLINKSYPEKYEAIKIAYVHQKFLWIHPFREANGLMSRLLSQAMMLKSGLSGQHNRIVNASLSLTRDPEKYLQLIKKADSGKEEDMLNWIEFALDGMCQDASRINKLFDYEFLKNEILTPSLNHPIFERLFTDEDRLIMDIAVEKQVFQAGDIKVFFPNKNPTEITKMIKWLRDKDLIVPTEDNARKYTVNLLNKYMVKQVVAKLDKHGFLPFEK